MSGMALLRAPQYRTLRGFAFDPSLSLRLDTAVVNALTLSRALGGTRSRPGRRVRRGDRRRSDLRRHLPAGRSHRTRTSSRSDGLGPSEGNPQFHQQMVYAVAMTTIGNFERALGRRILWAPRRVTRDGRPEERYVARLRVHPHALREANAYYSPSKKALLFGYFTAAPRDVAQQAPGVTVFTCLSHDIIAHETTHAMLDGLHGSYTLDTNPDVLAFHEAFADIVALFQHFTFPEVLRHQIARTRGNLPEPEPARATRAGVRTRHRAVRRPARRDRRDGSRHGRVAPAAARPGRLREAKGSRMRGAPSSSPRCSTRSSRSTSHASKTCCASPPGDAASCQRAPCTPTWWRGSPTKRRPARRTCCGCASARSTTARRSTSRSATSCARSSRPMSTSSPTTRSTTASRSSTRSARAASTRQARARCRSRASCTGQARRAT